MILPSQMDTMKTATENDWVVSLYNTGSVIAGHAMISVQGVELYNDFFGQYELTNKIVVKETIGQRYQASIGNNQGFIANIRVIESHQNNNPKNLEELSSRSWYASPENVKNMIASIKEDQKEIKKALEKDDVESLPPYQTGGVHRFTWLGSNGGHSCLTWAEEKLQVANINPSTSMFDSIKACPELHVNSCAIL
ncbi:MAG: hypothetical protein S4CHLAM123_15500 [Chlamydiales bacterium]|nr:hypothetical protein [Chlamydiales bacterium]